MLSFLIQSYRHSSCLVVESILSILSYPSYLIYLILSILSYLSYLIYLTLSILSYPSYLIHLILSCLALSCRQSLTCICHCSKTIFYFCTSVDCLVPGINLILAYLEQVLRSIITYYLIILHFVFLCYTYR